MKRIIAIACSVMIFAGCLFALPPSAESLYEILDKNEYGELYMERETGLIYYQNTSGTVRALCCENADSDAIATKAVKNAMRSAVMVHYIDANKTEFWANSYVSCIKKDTVTFKKPKKGNGTIVEYNFSREKENFIIPVQFSLEKDGIVAGADFSEIKENGKAKILSVRLLPYAVSGNKNENGYVIIPDGCGSAVAFNSTASGEAGVMIYGDDPTLTKREQITAPQAVSIPLIGAVYNDYATAAYIKSGAGDASYYVKASGTDSEYTSAAFDFNYRSMDITVLADRAWNEREVYQVSSQTNKNTPQLVIKFLEGVTAQPAGIASVYREYLIGNTEIAKEYEEPSCIFEVFGAVKKQKSFLGIPYMSTVTSTKVLQVEEMISEFSSVVSGNTMWMLYGFLNGGMYGKINDKFKLESAVGSNKDYDQLVKTAKENGAEVLPAVDMQHIYNAGLFSKKNAVKKMDNDYASQHFFKRNISTADKAFTWYLLKPNLLTKYTEKFIKNLKKKSYSGALMIGASDEVYSDYSKNYISRNQTIEEYINQAKLLSQKGSVWQSGGNSYMLPVSNGAVNVPSKSNGYDFESFEIPMYQLVFSGIIPISAVPINANESNYNKLRLKNIETGMIPHFRVTAESPAVYEDTQLDFLLNTEFKSWLESCKDICNEFNEIYADNNGVIINYKILGDVRCVTYKSGLTVCVNYGKETYNESGLNIEPMSYIIKQQAVN